MANIIVFGAGGKIGSRIVTEASNRGHTVRAVVRSSGASPSENRRVDSAIGDATDAESVRALANDADILVAAVGGPDKSVYLRAAQTLVATAKELDDNAPRIFHCGGGGSLLNNDGVRFVDTPAIPESLREEVLGQAAALDFYRTVTGVPWTYLSPPPGNFAPGERTGTYKTDGESPVRDASGGMGISYEDFAIAVLDEIENPKHPNARFTVGY